MQALRLLPLLVVIAAIGAAVIYGVPDALSWSALGARQTALSAARQAHPVASLLLYVAAYAAVVALSIPGSLVMTVAGGLLFGTALGGAAAAIGATLGAILLFLIVRLALRPIIARRAAGLLERIGPGLERDGFSYLLAIRLIPAFPFWLVNLAPALVGMRLLPYAAATLLGVIPAALVFASIGAGLGGVLEAGGHPDIGVIFSPRILLPLAGLAALSLLPVLWRRWRRSRHGGAHA
jgi:uncharacterized membrane protein YdjX (TVP38/TMEM64 family)